MSKSNYQVFQSSGQNPIKAWVNGVTFEDEALQQLVQVANLPFIFKHVAAMPDVHAGMGATIGSVIATKGAVIPAAVGVDCGCGVRAARLVLTKGEITPYVKEAFDKISGTIPNGRTDHGGINDIGRWGRHHPVPAMVSQQWADRLAQRYNDITSRHSFLGSDKVSWEHLGTLGSGNHFCELCVDQDNNVWIMIHSGSRGPGNRIGSYFIQRAKEECRKWFVSLPDPNLSYFPKDTELYQEYMYALDWALDFAHINRQIMLSLVVEAVQDILGTQIDIDFNIDCHHNYAAMENHYGQNVLVTRKGAVRARKKDYCIIPGSMGDKSYICKGLGNKDSFESCSHGAGRSMSRTKARKSITLDDHKTKTDGIVCCKTESVLDESPDAYKDIGDVISAQADLVDPVYILKQILCVKGLDH